MPSIVYAGFFAAWVLLALAAGGQLRSIALEFPSQARRFVAFLLLYSIIAVAIGLPFTSPPADPGAGDFRLPSLFSGHLVLVAFLLAWWRLRRTTSISSFLHLGHLDRAAIAGGLVLGLRVWASTLGVLLAIGVLAGSLVDLTGRSSALPDVDLPDVMLWMADLPATSKALIVAVAMTVEEGFFRAFLQARFGLLPSSLLFAVAHASYGLPIMLIGVFVVSILIGRDFAKHDNLIRCMLAHGVFDAIQLFIVVPAVIDQLQALGV